MARRFAGSSCPRPPAPTAGTTPDREIPARNDDLAAADTAESLNRGFRREGTQAAILVLRRTDEAHELTERALIQQFVDPLSYRQLTARPLARHAFRAAHLTRQILAPSEFLELWIPLLAGTARHTPGELVEADVEHLGDVDEDAHGGLALPVLVVREGGLGDAAAFGELRLREVAPLAPLTDA
jgi:hypothetical protein